VLDQGVEGFGDGGSRFGKEFDGVRLSFAVGVLELTDEAFDTGDLAANIFAPFTAALKAQLHHHVQRMQCLTHYKRQLTGLPMAPVSFQSLREEPILNRFCLRLMQNQYFSADLLHYLAVHLAEYIRNKAQYLIMAQKGCFYFRRIDGARKTGQQDSGQFEEAARERRERVVRREGEAEVVGE